MRRPIKRKPSKRVKSRALASVRRRKMFRGNGIRRKRNGKNAKKN